MAAYAMAAYAMATYAIITAPASATNSSMHILCA